MDAIHFLVEQGRVLYLGASDTPAWIVAAANTYAIDHGKMPFSIYQGRWNLLNRDFERDIIPMARHFGMAIAPCVSNPLCTYLDKIATPLKLTPLHK
jgi:aryl-alcohol dehydrogenase-like predicted oxidoreductase